MIVCAAARRDAARCRTGMAARGVSAANQKALSGSPGTLERTQRIAYGSYRRAACAATACAAPAVQHTPQQFLILVCAHKRPPRHLRASRHLAPARTLPTCSGRLFKGAARVCGAPAPRRGSSGSARLCAAWVGLCTALENGCRVCTVSGGARAAAQGLRACDEVGRAGSGWRGGSMRLEKCLRSMTMN